MRIRSSRRRTRVVAALIALVAVAALAVSGTWAALGGGTPVTTFAVEADGDGITTAKAVAVDGTVVTGKKDVTREYTIRITMRLTSNTAPVQAFQSGQTFASLKILYYDNTLALLKTYDFANATVVGYRQSAEAATPGADQELILRSTSLTVS
jgi:hypothetical protein